jgi:ribosomal-protein-alanine N-acetyltransferase
LLPALEALEAGDLELASSLAAPSLPPLIPFLISASNRGIWRRRIDSIAADPENTPWMSRLVVYQDPESGESLIVGRIGFHRKPDQRGMVEVGYEIDPEHMRKGHAKTAMRIVVELSRAIQGVNILKASIAPEKWIFRRIVEGEGLKKVGREVYERRGLEDIFEIDMRG